MSRLSILFTLSLTLFIIISTFLHFQAGTMPVFDRYSDEVYHLENNPVGFYAMLLFMTAAATGTAWLTIRGYRQWQLSLNLTEQADRFAFFRIGRKHR